MTRAKAYYQAYLVLECLSKEEYSLIPKELLEDIKSKMEVDPTIKVDKAIPLEKQKIDDKAYDVLDKVIRAIERRYGSDAIDNPDKYATEVNDVEVEEPPKKPDAKVAGPTEWPEVEVIDIPAPPPKKSSGAVEIGEDSSRKKVVGDDSLEVKKLKEENIRLKSIITALEIENKKIEEARDLFYDYKDLVTKKDERIKELEQQNEGLKQSNEDLHKAIQKVPKLVRKIFIGNYPKMLNSGK